MNAIFFQLVYKKPTKPKSEYDKSLLRHLNQVADL